jgi:hypothetical protein
VTYLFDDPIIQQIRESHERFLNQLPRLPQNDLAAARIASDAMAPLIFSSADRPDFTSLKAAAASSREVLGSVGPFADADLGGVRTAIWPLPSPIASGELYRLPYQGELNLLREVADQVLGLPELRNLTITAEKIVREAYTLSQPWIATRDAVDSFRGFSGLGVMGAALQDYSPFSDRLGDALRVFLGDWRLEKQLPADIASDPTARLQFYEGFGYDPSLAMFPETTFTTSLKLTGLAVPDFSPAVKYQRPVDREKPAGQDESSRRSISAYARLSKFETRIRRFIDGQMSKKVGPSWEKQRTGELYRKWRDKKEIARAAGEPDYPLISYADFTDYVQVIVRNDNWNEVFEAIFVRKSSIEESFYRLAPVRLTTMHSRPILRDDLLFLNAELTRLSRAISAHEDA